MVMLHVKERCWNDNNLENVRQQKGKKTCSDQFYFQNAVFTEKEPDKDQDYKDYVDIWLSLK